MTEARDRKVHKLMNSVEMLYLYGLKSIQDTLKLYLTLGALRK
jgi:hypothetical protein